MTGEQKLEFLEKQIRAVRKGHSDTIECPYCRCHNEAGDETPCCQTFLTAMWAILDRIELNEQKEHVERVMEQASKN